MSSYQPKMPRVGDDVLYLTGGDPANAPQSLRVVKVNQSLVAGHIFQEGRVIYSDEIRHFLDPWCEEHRGIVARQGAWGTWDDLTKLQVDREAKAKKSKPVSPPDLPPAEKLPPAPESPSIESQV